MKRFCCSILEVIAPLVIELAGSGEGGRGSVWLALHNKKSLRNLVLSPKYLTFKLRAKKGAMLKWFYQLLVFMQK